MSGGRIGRYQIQSLLGRGGMGVVYRAYDPQLDRTVAVKTIHLPENLNAYQRDKRTRSLLNEARLAARLNHPGIVKVYDAGEHEGEPYIVLECVEGRTLADILAEQRGGMELERALPIIQEVLEAVTSAHENGLIHRDLKPANIMVQPDGQVRIMDFGIARLAGAARSPEGLAGTPRYMSPEQFAGLSADTRSDVFSLGVVFYEMLSGQRPFPQADFEELIKAVRDTPHMPLQAHVAGLPAGLYTMVSRALAKRPEERFPGARQMMEALAAARVEHDAEPAVGADGSRKEIVDFILQKIARKGDFPTTMQYISSITRAARNENASATTIAEAILKDFALTNRLLRMVNSPYYNGARRSISTISRAVVTLGVDAVLDVAAGLSVFEHFHQGCDVPKLKAQTIRALMTAFHAREIANQVGLANSEEAFICGMLHHLGRLVVAFYFPEEYAAIEHLARQGGSDEAAASRKVMRITYSELGEAIAQQWHLPEAVAQCCRGLSASHKGPLKTPEQTLQCVVSMASELSKATMIPDDARRKAAQAAVARQFEGLIRLTPWQMGAVTEKSIRNAWDISHDLRINLKDLGVADSLLATAEQERRDGTAVPFSSHPGSEPSPSQILIDPREENAESEDTENARQEFLLKTMGEITMMLMGTFQLNDVLMMVLEGMYRGVGSRHVILALVNPARTHVIYRFGLGPQTEELRQCFQLPLNAAGGLPAQCILDAREVFAADLAGRPGALPAEVQALLRAKSLLLLPIVIREQAIGLFLLDRAPEQPAIDKHDLLNLRNLANQAVLAIKQCQSRR